jgi:hypothetical protein
LPFKKKKQREQKNDRLLNKNQTLRQKEQEKLQQTKTMQPQY